MNNLSGIPYADLQFTKDGLLFDLTAVDSLLQLLAQSNATDLLVMSHGWNNDMDEARELYAGLTKNLAQELPHRAALHGRRFAIAGVLWPSKKFADSDLIPGGGAADFNPVSAIDPLLAQLQDVQQVFDSAESPELIRQAMAEVAQFPLDPTSPARFVKLMAQLQPPQPRATASEPEDESAAKVGVDNPVDMLIRLSNTDMPSIAPAFDEGGATDLNGSFTMPPVDDNGGASGFLNLGALVSGARNLLNFTTYYQMKNRAGNVGTLGLNPVLRQVRAQHPSCRLHLIGHSFGARVVTAATAGPEDNHLPLPVTTLALLQGAFSHYGLAQNYDPGKDGLYRSVLSEHKLTGPLLISHTRNDKAVGLAYALASRVADQVAADFGGSDDRFGGMGANGAQLTPEVSEEFTLNRGMNYTFRNGVAYNLNADQTIADHSAIFDPQVTYAILSAIEVA